MRLSYVASLLLLWSNSIVESFSVRREVGNGSRRNPTYYRFKATPESSADDIPPTLQTKDVVTKVAVTGATGRTGKLVVDELLSRGVSNVVAIVRDMEKAKELYPNPPNNLEIVTCNLADENDIAKVVQGCDAGIWCATGFAQTQGDNLPESTTAPGKSIDLYGLPAFAKSISTKSNNNNDNNLLPKIVMCSSAGVTRLVWDENKQKQFVGAAEIPIVRLNPFNILDRKRESEEELRKLNIPYVICRPCGLNDKWPANSRPVFTQGDVAVGRLNRIDLASVLVDVLSLQEATNKTFEMVGIANYPKPRNLGPALARLKKDDSTATETIDDDVVKATYSIMQQLLPGERQESAALAMGQTYEELDAGKVGRLGPRGSENVELAAPKPSS